VCLILLVYALVLCYVFLSLPNKWYQSLELKEWRAKENENMVVESKRRLTKLSEVDHPRTGFITPSQVLPMEKCDNRRHTSEIRKKLTTTWAHSSTQCDIVAGAE
jgi:hypothetical protein